MENKTADYIIKNIIEKEIELNCAYNKKTCMGDMHQTFMVTMDDINDMHKSIIKKIKKHFK